MLEELFIVIEFDSLVGTLLSTMQPVPLHELIFVSFKVGEEFFFEIFEPVDQNTLEIAALAATNGSINLLSVKTILSSTLAIVVVLLSAAGW